jgi:hypothetical protein
MPSKANPSPGDAGTREFTCPMHPEVRLGLLSLARKIYGKGPEDAIHIA